MSTDLKYLFLSKIIGFKTLGETLTQRITAVTLDSRVDNHPEIRSPRSFSRTPELFYSRQSRDLAIGHAMQGIREVLIT